MIYQVQSVKRPALVVDMYTVKPLAKGQIRQTTFGAVRVLGPAIQPDKQRSKT